MESSILSTSMNRMRGGLVAFTAISALSVGLSGCNDPPHVSCDTSKQVKHVVDTRETYWSDAESVAGSNLSQEKRQAMIDFIQKLNGNKELLIGATITLPKKGSCHF